jgi:hypothetical protein
VRSEEHEQKNELALYFTPKCCWSGGIAVNSHSKTEANDIPCFLGLRGRMATFVLKNGKNSRVRGVAEVQSYR